MLSQLWDGTFFEWGEEPDGALSEAKSDGEDSPNAEGVAENFFMAPRSEERPFEEWDLRLSLENKDDNEPKRLVFPAVSFALRIPSLSPTYGAIKGIDLNRKKSKVLNNGAGCLSFFRRLKPYCLQAPH